MKVSCGGSTLAAIFLLLVLFVVYTLRPIMYKEMHWNDHLHDHLDHHDHHARLRLQTTCSNKGRLSTAYDTDTAHFISSTDPNKFHIITNLFLPTQPGVTKHLNTPYGKMETGSSKYKSLLEARTQELITSLQINLNHPEVALVHVMYDHPYVGDYLSKLELENCHKLILHPVFGSLVFSAAIHYAVDHLPGRFVIFMNQDIYLGDGWQSVNRTLLKTTKIMYALTRHPANPNCTLASVCSGDAVYYGSHDTYAFYARKEEQLHHLDVLNVQNDALGTENVLIWVFQNKLNYRVMNPCKVLFTHHLHCIRFHSSERERIDRKLKMTGRASFTDKLA